MRLDFKNKKDERDHYHKSRNLSKRSICDVRGNLYFFSNKLENSFPFLDIGDLVGSFQELQERHEGWGWNPKKFLRDYVSKGFAFETEQFYYFQNGVKHKGLIYPDQCKSLITSELLALTDIDNFKDNWRMDMFINKGFKCANPKCNQEGVALAISRESANLNCIHLDVVTANNTLMTVDHIIPVSKGGLDDLSNLRPMCEKCNSKLGNSQRY